MRIGDVSLDAELQFEEREAAGRERDGDEE
jgi:hypothetical protein